MAMTAPPTAAVTPLAPGPVPPPVAGAPTGRPVDPESPVSLGEGEALEDEVWLSLTDGVGELVSESVGVGLAEQEGVGQAVAVLEGVAVLEAVAEVEGVAELVPVAVLEAVQLVVGVGLQEGLGVGVAVPVAELDAVAVLVVVAVPVEPQLEGVSATAAPPSTADATETSRVAVPTARPTAPTLCSFSQLLCRDRRKIVTIPWEVRVMPS